MSKFTLILQHKEIFYDSQGEVGSVRMEIEVINEYGSSINTINIHKDNDGTLAFCGYKNYVLVDDLIEILQQIKKKYLN